MEGGHRLNVSDAWTNTIWFWREKGQAIEWGRKGCVGDEIVGGKRDNAVAVANKEGCQSRKEKEKKGKKRGKNGITPNCWVL